MKKNKTDRKEQAESKDLVKLKNTEKQHKFSQFIKKKWLIEGTTTIALISIIVAAFITLSTFMHNLDLSPIDLSQEQLLTISDESIEKIKKVDKDVNMYFVEFNEEDQYSYQNVLLAEEYHRQNDKIKVEIVTAETRPDLKYKYDLEAGTQGIIIECGEKSKALTVNDLYTYDTTTFERLSVAEEKFTSSILNVASEKVPTTYFLEGYSVYSLQEQMSLFGAFLYNEVNNVKLFNILATGNVPDDCDTLVICTPLMDFEDSTTAAIMDYINKGGNILWLNSGVTQQLDLPNVNKILAMYGVQPFDVGSIIEGEESKMLQQTPEVIFPNIEYSAITKTIINTDGVIFINATKINSLDDEELANQNITKNVILYTSNKSFFRNDYTIRTYDKTEADEQGPFVVGAEFIKTIAEENEENGTSTIKSKLVIYGDNNFITDYLIGNDENDKKPVFTYRKNKDLILNSMAYLVDREEDITTRKDIGTVYFVLSQEQDTLINIVIFAIPSLIIIWGIIIWIIRRRRK